MSNVEIQLPIIRCAYKEEILVSELKPHPLNPNQHPDNQIDLFISILIFQGVRRPITVSKRSGFVTKGHGQLIAYKKAGWERVPVDFQDYDSEEAELSDLVADNQLARMATLETGKLKEISIKLAENNSDMKLLGFDLNVLDQLTSEPNPLITTENEDTFFNPPLDPVTKLGDLYLLGEHRLLCGDATVLSDVQKLMGEERADMVWTDPPYNVAYEGKTKDALKIQNDEMSAESFYQFLYDAYSNMLMFTKPGGAIYVAHADSEGMNFRKALVDSGWLLKQCLIWVKSALVMGRQDYHWKHEPILYGWAPGASHNWYSDRKQTTVLEFDRPSRNAEHPTMKPIELIEYCLTNSCAAKGLVLDLFGGSGSTLIACEKTGRKAALVELDPRYCDVIVKRWESLTGQKATLL